MRVATWGDGLKDATTREWMRHNVDAVEVLVHVDKPFHTAGAEFFTCPTDPDLWDVQDVMNLCADLGLSVILNIDWHHGNGRSDSQSPVSAGKYHNAITEGGVDDGIRRIVQWARDDRHVIGLQLGNEQKTPDEWYADRCRLARQIIPSDWVLIIGGEVDNMEVGAEFADVIDPHLIRSDWRQRIARAESIADAHKLQIWATEMSPPLDVNFATTRMSEYQAMLAYMRQRGHSVGCFVGNTLDYPLQHGIRWNFKTLYDFTCWKNSGKTPIGAAWERYFGESVPQPPCPQPPGDDEPMTRAELEEVLAEIDDILEECNSHDSMHEIGADRRQFRTRIRGPLREVRKAIREALNQ